MGAGGDGMRDVVRVGGYARYRCEGGDTEKG